MYMRSLVSVALGGVLVACGGGTPDADGGSDRDGGLGSRDAGPVLSCEGVSDGARCGTAPGMICVANSCVASACGDGFVDPARNEDCDDGNTSAFDGCEPGTCTFTCTPTGTECDDGDVCDGAERCVDHRCQPGEPATEGTPCSSDAVPDGVCRPLPSPACVLPACGDGLLNEPEQCDDGRDGDATDGCADDCTFTCASDPACALSITPTNFDFGDLAEAMTSAEQSFMVQNLGSAATGALTVRLAGRNADNFTIVSSTCAAVVLGPFLTCTVTVRFQPALAGAREAMLVVEGTPGGRVAAEVRGRAVGQAGRVCGSGADCQSGFCTDGVCCGASATDCNGCRACNVAGSEGTCANVPAGVDPHGACTAVTCAGDCDGRGGCAGGDASMVCQTDGCTNGMLSEHLCSGTAPGCPAAITWRFCPGHFLCADATTCATSCTDDTGCYGGSYCEGGVCVDGRDTLVACTRDRHCLSGRCEGGLCRNCVEAVGGCGDEWTFCVGTADGANRCTHCADEGGSAFCASQGVGDTCTAKGSTGACTCSSSAQCTNAEAPNCLHREWMRPTDMINTCACYYTDDSGRFSWTCPRGRHICVANVPGDFFASCKGAAGEPCTTNADCASGSCSGGVCG